MSTGSCDPIPPLDGPEVDLLVQLAADNVQDGLRSIPPTPLLDAAESESVWPAILRQWLAALAPDLPPSLQAAAYSLSLQLVDDRTIAALNRAWRQQEGPTDVLAFAAQEESPPLPALPEEDNPTLPLELGDIVISLETAGRQAAGSGQSLEHELLFLASHGLLHLLGWDHPDEDSLTAMLALQEKLLASCRVLSDVAMPPCVGRSPG